MVRSAAAAGAALALLSACAPAGEDSAPAGAETASLAGTSWTVVLLDGAAPLDGRGGAPSIAFDDESRVAGSTGCNRFSGGYALGESGALTLGGEGAGLITTRMACAPMLNDQEARMLRVLGAVAGYAVGADGGLALTNAAGETVLEAAPAASDGVAQ